MQYANRKSVRATVGRVTLGFRVTDVLVYLPPMINDTFQHLLTMIRERVTIWLRCGDSQNGLQL